MSEFSNKNYNANTLKSSHVEADAEAGKKGFLMCEGCGAVYFKKHWHENLEALNMAEATSFEKNSSARFELCPACQLLKQHQYEGRVVIKNIPEKYAGELEGLVRNFCGRAEGRDPMDRLMEIKKSGNDWEVWLTENQLANKLAKKIKDVFDKAETTTHFASEPSNVAEAVVEFKAL